jgi:RNase H-fold protein (predicted Holliday junction resolvase)
VKTILSIDPGREKCGLAVVTAESVLHKEITSRDDLVRVAGSLTAEHRPDEIIIGGGTGGKALADELRRLISEIPIRIVDESFSTQRARARFFKDNPPRGIRRLIPRGLLTPDRPYDDYVALILAEEYLGPG